MSSISYGIIVGDSASVQVSTSWDNLQYELKRAIKKAMKDVPEDQIVTIHIEVVKRTDDIKAPWELQD